VIANMPQHLDDFNTLCNHCEATQRAVLADILSYACETEIGKGYHFGSIGDVATFRERIGTTTWNDVSPRAQRLQRGENDLLFPGRPPYFICTSGTTGGSKIVPESESGKAVKALTGRLRTEAVARHAPAIMQGKLLPLVNHAVEGYTDAGIPYGSASGITLVTSPKAVQKMVAFPMAVLDIDYCDTMDYILMRFAVAEDVRAIFGNNAGRIAQLINLAEAQTDALIDDIEKGTLRGIETLPDKVRYQIKALMQPDPARADALRRSKTKQGHFLPEAYWPSLQIIACWLSGSVGRYVETVRPLLSDAVRFFDVGYGATEGKFNIPLEPAKAAGPLAIHAAYYEFRDMQNGDFLMAHEVEISKSYELFVTTYSGLYRYAMGDIVRVEGFVGTTPEIVFEQKAGDMLNLCGEKVAAASLMPLVARAVIENTGMPPYHWCVVPDETSKRYHFRIELAVEPAHPDKTAKAIAERLETLLWEEALIYPIFRKQKLLQPLKVTLMAKGWQEALYAERTRIGQSRAQVKLPLVYFAVPAEKFAL